MSLILIVGPHYIGTPTCKSSNGVYSDQSWQTYVAYACKNPGTDSSSCSSSTSPKMILQCPSNQVCRNGACVRSPCYHDSDCGETGYIGSPSCGGVISQDQVWQNFMTATCNNPGTDSSSCNRVIVNKQVTQCKYPEKCANGSCQKLTCSGDSDCGKPGYVGNKFCQGKSVHQQYATYSCVNPGTSKSSCKTTLTNIMVENCDKSCLSGKCTSIGCYSDYDCGTADYSGKPSCIGNNVWQNYNTHPCVNPGTALSYCGAASQILQLKTRCTQSQLCVSGTCKDIACSQNTDCGTDEWTGTPSCTAAGPTGDLVQNYITWSCNSPGKVTSSCTSDTKKDTTVCPKGCVVATRSVPAHCK